ncbi:hypothetical protein Q8A73_012458 [Channa argus]|nr:hypothetical protein Q8A73_012458 [Channa argus]
MLVKTTHHWMELQVRAASIAACHRTNEIKIMKQEDQDPDLALHENMCKIKEENDPDFNNQSSTDFVHQAHFKSEMTEENQDPDFIGQDHYNREIKEEYQDPGFVHQAHIKSEIKENQDSDFTYRDHCKSSRIKEENEDADFTNQDENEIKEENQDPDFINVVLYKVEIKEENEDPNHQTSEPAGPSDDQVSDDELMGKNGLTTRLKKPVIQEKTRKSGIREISRVAHA